MTAKRALSERRWHLIPWRVSVPTAFPARGPSDVRLERGDRAWLVICHDHGWLCGSREETASGFAVAILEVCR
jgi:hypothetical protein